MTGSVALALLLLFAGGAAADETAAALRARVAAEISANPWRAARLAGQWAALKGLSDAERAEALTEEARARADVGDYAGAETALGEALKARPGDPEASLLLAEATRDRPDQALLHAEDAARAGAPRERAAAYRLAAEIRLDLGDEAGARDELKRALQLAPDDLDALVLAASVNRDEPQAALKHARSACAAADAQPSWRRAAALRVCARSLSDLKDYQGAMAALGKALALDIDDADTLRAILRVKGLSPAQKTPSPAASPARKAALAADDLETLRSRFEAGKSTELAAAFTAAIGRAPQWQRLDAYRLSARQWLALGDAKKAVASLVRAEDLDSTSVATEKLVGQATRGYIGPALSEAYEAAMRLRLALGDPAGADAVLARGLELTPENFQLLSLLVDRKLDEKKPREALPFAERMDAVAKKNAPPAFWNPEKQGLLSGADRAKQGDLLAAQNALDAVRKAIAREPSK